MDTPVEVEKKVVDARWTDIGHAMSRIRKAYRDHLPITPAALDAKRIAENLASALGHLADLHRSDP